MTMDESDFQVALDQQGRTYSELEPFIFDLYGLKLLIMCQHGPFGYSYRAEARLDTRIAYGALLHRSMGFEQIIFIDIPAWMGAQLSDSSAITDYPNRNGDAATTRIPIPTQIALQIRTWADEHHNRGRRHIVHGHWRTPSGQIVVSQYAGRSQTKLALERWDAQLARYVCIYEVIGTAAESLALAAAIGLITQAQAVPIQRLSQIDPAALEAGVAATEAE